RGLRGRADNAIIEWTDAQGPQTLATPTPTAALRELLAQHEGEIQGLEVRNPSLEDVYLELIGQAAADAAALHDTEEAA
ncbi:MAG: ABC transporter ATP-binding protein, partial [Demequina sp.]